MSRTVKTYKDLCEERERLTQKLAEQKQRLVEDWRGVKGELTPVKSVFRLLGKMGHADKSNPLVNFGLKMATDLVLKNYVLGKAGWAAKLAIPFVVRNYSSHLIAQKAGRFLAKLTGVLSRKKEVNYERQEEENSQYRGTEPGGQPL